MVAHCLGRPLNLERISEPLINERYEAHLLSWLPEHPFVRGRRFRNAVFESVAVATLISSGDPLSLPLALEYVDSHKYNYHIIYFLDRIARDGLVPIRSLRVIADTVGGDDIAFYVVVPSRSPNSTTSNHRVHHQKRAVIQIVETPTGPRPIARLAHQASFHGIVMHVRELLISLLLAPDIHVVSAALPDPVVRVMVDG